MISENQGDGCSKLEIESPLHDFTKANVFLLLWKATPENMSAWFRCNFFLDCEYIDFSIWKSVCELQNQGKHHQNHFWTPQPAKNIIFIIVDGLVRFSDGLGSSSSRETAMLQINTSDTACNQRWKTSQLRPRRASYFPGMVRPRPIKAKYLFNIKSCPTKDPQDGG